MNLTDLRSTLERRADFSDAGLPARASRVHQRVRVVRRRRRAAVAGGLAAAVAVVASVIALPRLGGEEPVPAERRFADLTAPATMEALGHTYAFDRLVTGDGRVSVSQRIGERPVLLTWANAGGGPITVEGDLVGEPSPRPSVGGDFEDYVIVPAPGASSRFSVRSTGEVAIAVYELSALAPGPARAALHVPQQSAERTLLTSVIGEPGQAEVSIEFRVPAGPWELVDLCHGVPRPMWVSVEVANEGPVSSHCGAGLPFLTGPGGQVFGEGGPANGLGPRPGDTVTVRAWVATDDGGAPGERVSAVPPEAQLALAVYDRPSPADRVAGWTLPEVVEHDGHQWELDTTKGAATTGPLLRAIRLRAAVVDRPLLVMTLAGGSSTGEFRAGIRFLINGQERSRAMHRGFMEREVVLVEGSHDLELRFPSGTVPDAPLGIALYERMG